MRDLRGKTHLAPPPASAMADGRPRKPIGRLVWVLKGFLRLPVLTCRFVIKEQSTAARRVDLKQRCQGLPNPFGAGEDDKNK